MDLATFLSEYPGVRIATPDDNPRVLAFYDSLQMAGGSFNIVFAKDPDYFRFLRYEGPEHYVMLIENDEGTVEGMATLAVRPCYVDGKPERVGHFSDLRFLPRKKRKNPFDWKRFMHDFLTRASTMDEFADCRTWLGSFVMANEFARKAFTSQKTPFDISPVANYQMVNLLLRRPLGGSRLRKFAKAMAVDVSRGSVRDLAEIEAFLDAQSRARALGYVYTGPESELRRRLRDWDGFAIEDVFVARDAAGAIVGCLAAWDPSAGRRIVVDGLPPGLSTVARMAKALGRRVPTPGDALEILYLTTQELSHRLGDAERRAVFVALLQAVYEVLPVDRYHMVAATDYSAESLLDVFDSVYFTQKTPTLLYQMHLPGAAHVLREDKLKHRAGHEMCLT